MPFVLNLRLDVYLEDMGRHERVDSFVSSLEKCRGSRITTDCVDIKSELFKLVLNSGKSLCKQQLLIVMENDPNLNQIR